MRRTITVLLFSTTLAVTFWLANDASYSLAQQGGGPEGDGRPAVNPTSPIPTRPPTPDPNGPPCDAYLFQYLQVRPGSTGLLAGTVDRMMLNGVALPSFVPNQVFDPSSPLHSMASNTRPLYQLAGNLPPNVAQQFDDWFLPRIREGFERFWNPNNPNAIQKATDVFLNWRFWGWMCSLNKRAFRPYQAGDGRWFSCDDEGVTPRGRQWIIINGVQDTQNFYDNFCFSNDGGNMRLMDECPSTGNICDLGAFYSVGCPLSLVLDDGHDINSDVRMVDFPIDPSRSGQTFLWKASGAAPLLVYDPSHTGEITSASQLFGHFSFGGRATASLAQVAPQLWRDGFEALGSLDRNHDGAVAGDELTPLALWSDFNRNGRSEPGEVKAVTDHGITKLFYNAVSSRVPGEDVVLPVGFERTVDGRTVTGRSVDWYSTSASTASQLVGKLLSLAAADGALSGRTKPSAFEVAAEVDRHSTVSSVHQLPPYVGGWRWKLKGDYDVAPFGYLVIGPKKGGGYGGMNFALQPAPAKVMKDAAMNLVASSFDISEGSDGTTKFNLFAPGGTTIESTVTVSPDGKRMFGKSSAAATILRSTLQLSYEWVAERVDGKPEPMSLKTSHGK